MKSERGCNTFSLMPSWAGCAITALVRGSNRNKSELPEMTREEEVSTSDYEYKVHLVIYISMHFSSSTTVHFLIKLTK